MYGKIGKVSSWQQHADTDVFEFEVDLRIPGVPDAAVQDENPMKDINEKMEN